MPSLDLKNKQIPNHSAGFSIAGVLVGIGLLGILTMGTMQVFSNMALNQNFTKFRTEVDNFGEELRTQLGTKEIFTATFNGIILDPTQSATISAIKDAVGNTMFAVPSPAPLGDNSFTISSVNLKGQPGAPWYIEDNPATGAGRMIVTVAYRAAAVQAGPKDSFRTYTMATHRNLSTSKLIDCIALGKSADGIWKYNNSDIYFNGGNVGIGTTDPKTILDVNGPIRSGGVVTGGGCTAKGSLAYDMTTYAPVYCNATGTWAAPSGGPPPNTAGAPCNSPNFPYGGIIMTVHYAGAPPDGTPRCCGMNVPGAANRYVMCVDSYN